MTKKSRAKLRLTDNGDLYVVYASDKDLQLSHSEISPAVWITPYSLETRQELDVSGIIVPPLSEIYDWPGFYEEPRDIQRQMAEFDLKHHRYWNTSEMRTGKSAGVLWPTDMQMRWEGLRRLLILAPKNALIRTWQKEIMSIMPHVSAFYSDQPSTKALKEALDSNKYRVMVVNYDKFWRCLREIVRWGPDKIIADEASEVNDRTTKRARGLRDLFKDRDHIKFCALTGTPLPNRPTDIWSVSRFINPDTPPSYHQFETSIMRPAYTGSRKLIAQPWAKGLVTKLMVPNIHFKTDDVPGMPEHETLEYGVEMGKEQAVAFRELKNQFYTETVGKEITVRDAGEKLWKLVQVAAGSAISDDGTPMIVGAQPKVDALKRIIREAQGKVVIFARYRAVQDYIMKQLGGFEVRLINGKTKESDQRQYVKEFQYGNLNALLLNPDMFKYAEQLDAGSANVWWHPVHSSLVYLQASARIRGTESGISGKTVSYNLYCNNFERQIYKLVLQRMKDQDEIKSGTGAVFDELDVFTRLVLEDLNVV